MEPGRRPSLLDGGYPPPPATYPGAARRATSGSAAPARPLRGLAPGEVYPAGRSPGRWWALTPPLHPYRMRRRSVSVALSVGLPRLGVTQHPALWSSDFPRAGLSARGRPARLGSWYRSNAGDGAAPHALPTPRACRLPLLLPRSNGIHGALPRDGMAPRPSPAPSSISLDMSDINFVHRRAVSYCRWACSGGRSSNHPRAG